MNLGPRTRTYLAAEALLLMNLPGFERVELRPGESKRMTPVADLRLLARFDAGWRVVHHERCLSFGTWQSAGDLGLTAQAELSSQLFGH